MERLLDNPVTFVPGQPIRIEGIPATWLAESLAEEGCHLVRAAKPEDAQAIAAAFTDLPVQPQLLGNGLIQLPDCFIDQGQDATHIWHEITPTHRVRRMTRLDEKREPIRRRTKVTKSKD